MDIPSEPLVALPEPGTPPPIGVPSPPERFGANGSTDVSPPPPNGSVVPPKLLYDDEDPGKAVLGEDQVVVDMQDVALAPINGHVNGNGDAKMEKQGNGLAEEIWGATGDDLVEQKPSLAPPSVLNPSTASGSRSPSPGSAFKLDQSTAASGSSTPLLDVGASPAASRGGAKKGKGKAVKKEKVKMEIQYIDDLPEATEEAKSTFTTLEANWYQNKSIGRTKQQEEMMVCDCTWKPGDDPDMACSEDSGCINYLTQVECIASECRCRSACLNQRFERRQYAPIEIVKTEKKGFGMRCKERIPSDTFVYEYIGEVVGDKAFQKRMKDYADEGLRHFYFMQLQREEFIDATKKGGLGRFLNHSCNPNCYIAKWVVGRQLRMGIFTKRAVSKNEELTFNYNVDRYGHEAQECYCGEPNCVGFLGGKTQTDVGAMDDLYLDALGIADDVEALTLKGSKTKKGKKMDVDYMPIMKPIPLKDVPKVASAIRQSTSNRRILSKLIKRIQITEDSSVQRQLMRLHGFSLMSMVLNEYLDDPGIVEMVLGILLTWPLITKNKLVSTNIEETVVKLSENPSEVIQAKATELVQMWLGLEVSYRIAKVKDGGDGSERKRMPDYDELNTKRVRLSPPVNLVPLEEITFVKPERAKMIDVRSMKPEDIPLPPGWVFAKPEEGKHYFFHAATKHTQWHPPTPFDVSRIQRQVEAMEAEAKAKAIAAAFDVNDIVGRARAEAEAAKAKAQAIVEAEEAEKARKKEEKIAKRARAKARAEEKAAAKAAARKAKDQGLTKDKKILRLFSAVVVKTMSRYKGSLDHEQFKKRAKEVTDLMCEKEKKSSSYNSDPYDKLSPEKEAKIKQFVKDWTAKLLARKGLSVSSSSSRRPSSSNTPRERKPSSSSSRRERELPATPQTPVPGSVQTPTTTSPVDALRRSMSSAMPTNSTDGDVNDLLLAEINGDEDGDEVVDTAAIDAEMSEDEAEDDEDAADATLTMEASGSGSAEISALPTQLSTADFIPFEFEDDSIPPPHPPKIVNRWKLTLELMICSCISIGLLRIIALLQVTVNHSRLFARSSWIFLDINLPDGEALRLG